jgi:transposase
MTNPAKAPVAFIGCDVGKTAIAVFDSRDNRAQSIPNRPDALAVFAKSIDLDCFVVCEATGGHEAALLAAMVSAGIPVHRADARKVKAFIRSYGTLGKTDAIDARALAVDAATTALIRDNAPLRQAVGTLTSITSIGVVTATSLLALMPELGRLDRRQVAALGGLAPHPNQSGASDGYRRTKGGRPEVRKALFMAALSAARHHKTLRPFYEKLIAKGKKKLVALTAVMRKLLIICNAVLRPDGRLVPGTPDTAGH